MEKYVKPSVPAPGTRSLGLLKTFTDFTAA